MPKLMALVVKIMHKHTHTYKTNNLKRVSWDMMRWNNASNNDMHNAKN